YQGSVSSSVDIVCVASSPEILRSQASSCCLDCDIEPGLRVSACTTGATSVHVAQTILLCSLGGNCGVDLAFSCELLQHFDHNGLTVDFEVTACRSPRV